MKNINVFVPKFRKEEVLSEIGECLDKGWTGLGYKTVEFEKKWSEYCFINYSHFLSSNTVGLHLAVKILKHANKWKDGDEISVTVNRDGKDLVLKGKVNLPKEEKSGFIATDKSKEAVKNAWLKS